MSDTVKLIIEISKENLKRISDGEWIGIYAYDNMILNGTPLDTVKSEIEEYRSTIDRAISEDELKIEGMKEAYTDCLKIIDNIGKTESEVKK